MIDSRQASEQDQATEFALRRAIALVLFPGLTITVGLIVLLMPALPPISTVYGCYRLNAFPLLRVGPRLISAEGSGIIPVRMTIERGKEGYVINAETGISFETSRAGAKQAIRDFPLGELIPVFVSQSGSPSLGIIADGEQIKVPKIACPE